jgi:histone H3/H4
MAPKKTTKRAPQKTARTAAKRAGKKPAGKAAAKEMLLVGSKTKEAMKASGMNVAGDALEGLNTYVHWLIDQACKRAEANGRKTIRPHDFVLG